MYVHWYTANIYENIGRMVFLFFANIIHVDVDGTIYIYIYLHKIYIQHYIHYIYNIEKYTLYTYIQKRFKIIMAFVI